MRYLITIIILISSSLSAEEEPKHHNLGYSYSALPIVGSRAIQNYQYEYILDSNTGLSINYTNVEESAHTVADEDYEVEMFTLKATQYFLISRNWSLYAAISYGQATPTFYAPIRAKDNFMSEFYFDDQRGFVYSAGFRKHIAKNIYWGLGLNKYNMGDYSPDGNLDLALNYRF